HIGLVVFPMVDFHGRLVDIGLQRIGSVGQRGKCESHVFSVFSLKLFVVLCCRRFDATFFQRHPRGGTSAARGNDYKGSASPPEVLLWSRRRGRSCRVFRPSSQ